jgi:hypothetical protein
MERRLASCSARIPHRKTWHGDIKMDNSQIVLWGRTVERLLTVGFSGLSIVLGWSLFKARLLRDQTAEFTSKSWTIRLERVGPGIFFALFGVLGL